MINFLLCGTFLSTFFFEYKTKKKISFFFLSYANTFLLCPFFKAFIVCLTCYTTQGLRQDFRTVVADFHMHSKKLKINGTFVPKLRVQNQIFKKPVGAKLVFLKLCGCSCTHCTHTNQDPVQHYIEFVTWKQSTYSEIYTQTRIHTSRNTYKVYLSTRYMYIVCKVQ